MEIGRAAAERMARPAAALALVAKARRGGWRALSLARVDVLMPFITSELIATFVCALAFLRYAQENIPALFAVHTHRKLSFSESR